MYDIIEEDDTFTLTMDNCRIQGRRIVEADMQTLNGTITFDEICRISLADETDNLGVRLNDKQLSVSNYDYREIYILCFMIAQDRGVHDNPQPKVDDPLDQFDEIGLSLLHMMGKNSSTLPHTILQN